MQEIGKIGKIGGMVDIEEDINIDEYNMDPEEYEMQLYTDMLNIYTIYYKQTYKKSQNMTLFDNIDPDDATSTNRQLELFYKAIQNHKIVDTKLYEYNKYITILKQNNIIYCVEINNTKFLTYSLISAILHVHNNNYLLNDWTIKINEPK